MCANTHGREDFFQLAYVSVRTKCPVVASVAKEHTRVPSVVRHRKMRSCLRRMLRVFAMAIAFGAAAAHGDGSKGMVGGSGTGATGISSAWDRPADT